MLQCQAGRVTVLRQAAAAAARSDTRAAPVRASSVSTVDSAVLALHWYSEQCTTMISCSERGSWLCGTRAGERVQRSASSSETRCSHHSLDQRRRYNKRTQMTLHTDTFVQHDRCWQTAGSDGVCVSVTAMKSSCRQPTLQSADQLFAVMESGTTTLYGKVVAEFV